MRVITKSLGAALLLAVAPVEAQPKPRILEVPATASWQHAATGMILPPSAAGLRRGSVVDRTAAERDVSADYGGEDGLTTSVYLFQTPSPTRPCGPTVRSPRSFCGRISASIPARCRRRSRSGGRVPPRRAGCGQRCRSPRRA